MAEKLYGKTLGQLIKARVSELTGDKNPNLEMQATFITQRSKKGVATRSTLSKLNSEDLHPRPRQAEIYADFLEINVDSIDFREFTAPIKQKRTKEPRGILPAMAIPFFKFNDNGLTV